MTYHESLPQKRMGSGVLFVDDSDQILIVRPTYKEHWEIPGGVVEENESPRRCAVRETAEELDLDVDERSLGLLTVDYLHPTAERTEALMFVFFGGVLGRDDIAEIELERDELDAFRFVRVETAVELLGEIVGPRVRRGVSVLEGGQIYYERE